MVRTHTERAEAAKNSELEAQETGFNVRSGWHLISSLTWWVPPFPFMPERNSWCSHGRCPRRFPISLTVHVLRRLGLQSAARSTVQVAEVWQRSALVKQDCQVLLVKTCIHWATGFSKIPGNNKQKTTRTRDNHRQAWLP